MELPRRDPGDELLRPGELADIRLRLRNLAAKHDLATVIVHAFDDRTRMLPFIHTDRRMAPGGVRAIGAAMVDAGFYKTRIVLQQWNKNFRPSQMRLDGRIPDLFMVSSMQLHSAPCDALIRDACRIDLADRPLIIAGGPRVIYQPWEVFASDSTCPWGADVAVTGEEYVLLSLLEVLLSIRERRIHPLGVHPGPRLWRFRRHSGTGLCAKRRHGCDRGTDRYRSPASSGRSGRVAASSLGISASGTA